MANCPTCGYRNDDAAEMCFTCGRALFGLTQGSLLGDRYEIREPLGRGGMGMVYKAHDRKLDEIVAIKILRAGFAGNPELEKRFLSEIKLARKVTHKNICRIHEYGEHQGVHYISMALVEGTDLKRIVKDNGPLPAAEAYDAAIQVAEGLQAIHEEGIVHRDLKPANLVRDAKGVVRLLDFGIAKETGTGTDGLTSTGMVVGTPDYVSPEQALGKQADSRSDIYSLGVVIFELFTGQAPFKGDNAFNTMQKHVHQQPPLDGIEAARLPRPMIPILRKALAKDPSLRYQTAREVADALKAARDSRAAASQTLVPAATPHTLSQAATTVKPGPRTLRPTPRPELESPVEAKQEARSSWTSPWLPLGAFAVLLALWMLGPGASSPRPTPAAPGPASAEPVAPERIGLQPPPAAAAPAAPLDSPSQGPADPAVTSPQSSSPEPAPDASTDSRRDMRDECARGRGEACLQWGEDLRSGRSGALNPALAADAFERACRYGVPRGCAAAGAMYFFAQGVAEDKPRAMELLKQACDGHVTGACSLLEQVKRMQERRLGPPAPRQP